VETSGDPSKEHRLEALIRRYTGLLALLNADGRPIWSNGDIADAMERGMRATVHPDDVDAVSRAWREALAQPWAPKVLTYRARTRDGSWRRYDGAFTNLLVDPSVRAVVLEGFAGSEDDALRHRRGRVSTRVADLLRFSRDLLVVLDGEGRLVYASAAVFDLLGYETDQVVGHPVWSLIHDGDRTTAQETFAALADAAGEVASDGAPLPLRLRHRDGQWIECELVANARLDDPAIAGIVVNIRDVSERRRLEAGLREAEVRFEEVFTSAPIGMVVIGRDGAILRVNPAFAALIDRKPDDLAGARLADLVHPDDREEHVAVHDGMLAGETSGYAVERRLRGPGDRWIWARVTTSLVQDATGEPLYWIAQVEDVTERRRLVEQLEYEATHDRLTGLASRRLVLDHLDLALANARRHGGRVAVVFFDLDGFKAVNDTFGHAVGDAVLAAVADRVRAAVRAIDTPGRWGGDEFVVVCPSVDRADDAVAVAERIRDRLADDIRAAGLAIPIGASLGVAVVDGDSDPDALLRAADLAAYRAKTAGGDRTEVGSVEADLDLADDQSSQSGARDRR
jgi:diguanylate cyclase (GGDEF)-like protein/PAS domain S-box-containing protein